MNEREQISALVDGELPPAERDALVLRMERDSGLSDTWRRYQLAHAALQHEAPSAVDLSARVMAALDDEPVILAPRALPQRQPLWRQTWARAAGGMALAASLTLGVALVWQQNAELSPAAVEIVSLIHDGSHPQVLVAPEQAADDSNAAPQQVALNDTDRENAYMLAHAEYSDRGVDDGIMPYARVAGQSEDQ